MVVFNGVEIEASSRVFGVICAVPAMAPRQPVEGSHSAYEKAHILNSFKSKNRAAWFKCTANGILRRNVSFIKCKSKFGSELILVG